MSDAQRIKELEAKVKSLQESLSKVGQKAEKGPKPSQKEQNQAAKAEATKQENAKAEKNKPPNDAEETKDLGGPTSTNKENDNQDAASITSSSSSAAVSSSSSKPHNESGLASSQNSGVNSNGSNKKSSARSNASSSRLALFDHLPVQKPPPPACDVDGDRLLHPSILKLGSMYRSGLIQEDDDRVSALLCALCGVIQDYKTPPNKSLSRELDKFVQLQEQHLVDCRAHCIGMANLINHLRYVVSKVPPDMSEAEAKAQILDKLHSFLRQDVVAGGESIGKLVAGVIHHNDVILTFGSTPLLRKVLLAAAAEKKFRLIVVDSRPLNDGLRTLRACSPYMDCVYTPLSGAAKVMGEATRVILGASAMLSNGSMLAAAGTAVVASLAKYRHVPVIALCESYKFTERVQLDSIVHNELGSPRELAIADLQGAPTPQLNPGYFGGANKAANDMLPFSVVNLRYDCTPIGNISAVATGTGLIPPTSVPVLIRELRAEMERSSAF
jgi:translation initiation factor eIF-2B subunit delta